MPVIFLAFAWIVGVLAGLAWALPVALGLAAIPAFALAHSLPARRDLFLVVGICIVAFTGGIARTSYKETPHRESTLQLYNGVGTVIVEGYVSNEPEVGTASSRVRFVARAILRDSERSWVSGAALLTLPRYPELHYGNVVMATGELQGRPEASTDGASGRYWEQLTDTGIVSTMYYPEIQIQQGFRGWRPLGWLYIARNNLLATLQRVLPEPQAALAQGITFGVRTNIPSSLKTDFARTGTTHLLAISGVNLTIIAGMIVTLIVHFLGRRRYAHVWLTFIVVWLYAWLTGLEPPVVRAAIMVTFFLAADLLGRQRSAVIALLLAACIMIGVTPEVILDASFQLSFAAMAGLVFVLPLLEPIGGILLERVPEGRLRTLCLSVAGSLEVSLAAVVATWPLTAHYFGLFSWVGPIATFLAMPVMAPIIITCLLAAVSGLAFLPLGQAVAWLAWLPLSYLMLIAAGFGSISGASSYVGTMPTLLVAAYYVMLAALVAFYQRRTQLLRAAKDFASRISLLPMKWVIPPLSVTALLSWLALAAMPDNNLHVSFLDVGQGDAILIAKGSHQILIDGGPDPQPVIVEMSKKMPFWDRTLDMVVLTHPDADHLGGLVEVIRRYRVAKVIAANVSYDSPLFREWQRLVLAKPGRLTTASAGETISLGSSVRLDILSPRAPTTDADSLNETSVVVRVAAGKVSFLLTGDLPTTGENEMVMRRAHLRSTVLKVAHHGSAASTGEVFLKVADPEVAVMSVGKGNNYGHPSKETIARLEQEVDAGHIYRTDESGTIEFITDGDKLWVNSTR